MLLLDKDITMKGQVNNLLELELEVDERENKEYEIKAIVDNVIYAKDVKGYLLELYYLVS